MGFIKRLLRLETRSETVSVDDNLKRLLGGQTTAENALNIPAVAACVDFISGKIAELPIKLYKSDDKNKKAQEVTDDNRLNILNDETGDLLDPCQMKRAFVRDMLIFGSGYIYPEWERNTLISLKYIKNEKVCISKNADPIFKSANFIIGNKIFCDDEIMRLLRNSNDGVKGTGVPQEHKELINAAYKELIYERYLVESGGNKKGFLQAEKPVAKEQFEELKKTWKELYSNTENNLMFLNSGMKFVESSNTSVEMQLNESKISNNNLICQIFGLSPSVVSGKASDEEYVTSIKTAVVPVVKDFQAALNKALLLPSERKTHYFELDMSELLKGDMLKRYQAYEIALKSGFRQFDDIRYSENLEPYGINWLKLGLQDVLYDPKTQNVYIPNMNKTMNINEKSKSSDESSLKSIDSIKENDTMEKRNKDNYIQLENVKMAGSYGGGSSSGGSKSSKGSGNGSKIIARPKMSKKEVSRVSHSIATDFPILKADGTVRKYDYGNYSYRFTVNEFNSYRFISKMKLK